MPELPDVAALEPRILAHPLGRVRVASPVPLRTTNSPLADAAGRKVRELRRIGKRIAIGIEGDLWMPPEHG